MGRGSGHALEQVLPEPATGSTSSRSCSARILYGDLSEARPLGLRAQPLLELSLPDFVRVDRFELRDLVRSVSNFSLAPATPEDAGPIGYLHLRIRRQIERLRVDQGTPPSPEETITFQSSEMACLKLPEGKLFDFKLQWNEWDMVLGAVSWSYRDTSNEDYAQIYRSLLDEDPAIRGGRISCVRCGLALEIDDAIADPRAYRCENCPATR